jgi:hypothetical protein
MQRCQAVLDSEIANIYCNSRYLPVADHHYLNISLPQLLQSRPAYKRRWLFRVKAARARMLREEEKQPKINRFFVRLQISNHIRQKSQTLQHRHQQLLDDDARRRTRIRHTKSMQQLLTKFLKERASNGGKPQHTVTSPPPP